MWNTIPCLIEWSTALWCGTCREPKAVSKLFLPVFKTSSSYCKYLRPCRAQEFPLRWPQAALQDIGSNWEPDQLQKGLVGECCLANIALL